LTVEDIHGEPIDDPFRRLENAEDPETEAWSAGQDLRFAAARDGWADRGDWAADLEKLFRVGAIGAPVWRGDRSFSTRRDPGQDHAVLLVTEPSGEERVLVDPGVIDPTGRTVLDAWSPSKEGDLLAYALSESGTEWATIRVLDVTTGDIVDGPIGRTRHPSIAWLPGGRSFYYPRYLTTDEADEERWLRQRLYRHELGHDPESDELVFGDGLPRATNLGVSTSDDGRWLTVSAFRGTDARNDVWLGVPGDGMLTPVSLGEDAISRPYFDARGELWLLTNLGAPRWRLLRWADGERVEALPEDPEAVLVDAEVLADEGLLVAVRSRHAVSEVTVHELGSGRAVRRLELPGPGTVTTLTRRATGSDIWVGWTDFTTPAFVLHADASKGTSEVYARPPGTPDTAVTTRQVVYTSYDGTPVHMFVIAPAGAEESTPRPTVLYGYGGFNISITPGYSPSIQAWVARGGVYAVANLRGGSEEGEEWHRAGMREHKQNVFDDFAAASDWLVEHGVTTRALLGIRGGSNGGLLVGAAVTQHPAKWSAAVCSAPLLDMLRYERFGLGEYWNGEYGTVAEAEEFRWLRAYSPYHNVRPGTPYPAVLFTVFEGDTRVDTMHARKMCALLQRDTSGAAPILIRREVGVGHSTRAVSRDVELAADELSFLSNYLRAAARADA
jgi:prolyl oligopeptidase